MVFAVSTALVATLGNAANHDVAWTVQSYSDLPVTQGDTVTFTWTGGSQHDVTNMETQQNFILSYIKQFRAGVGPVWRTVPHSDSH